MKLLIKEFGLLLVLFMSFFASAADVASTPAFQCTLIVTNMDGKNIASAPLEETDVGPWRSYVASADEYSVRVLDQNGRRFNFSDLPQTPGFENDRYGNEGDMTIFVQSNTGNRIMPDLNWAHDEYDLLRDLLDPHTATLDLGYLDKACDTDLDEMRKEERAHRLIHYFYKDCQAQKKAFITCAAGA